MRRAVIVGRALGALEEYRAACAMCTFDDVIIVGKMGEVFPDRIDHWVSFHVLLFDKWAAARVANGLSPAGCFWGAIYRGNRVGRDRHGNVGTRQEPLRFVSTVGGSSGFMAVQVALAELGADRVVLAGCPMTAEGHHAAESITEQEAARGYWDEADKYWPTWLEQKEWMAGRVRSMSGRTMAEFGYPDGAWLGV